MTIAASPAAGPLTLMCEPLSAPTTMPPMIPEMTPEMMGAPEASAIPRQSGIATRNTTRPAMRSPAIGAGRSMVGEVGWGMKVCRLGRFRNHGGERRLSYMPD